MNKKEIFDILYGKETWDIWYRIQDIEKEIDNTNYLYTYFDDFKEMLLHEKAYVRMRSFRIMCRLSKWDKDNKINGTIDLLLQVLDNSKPTIVRMCLASIDTLLLYKKELSSKVRDKLKAMDLSKYKDSMRPLIEKDVLTILNNTN